MSDIDVVPPTNQEIAVTFDKETLADIIVNFLGKKETLSYKDKNYFVIRLGDIEQFYYLIDSKIEREQNTSIGNFSVSIVYNDGTKRTINGINALQSFQETRSVFPESINISWHIIIKFPNSKAIETQKIDILLEANTEGKSKSTVTIENTNQSWANEILFVIKNHLATFRSKQQKNTYSHINNIADKIANFHIIPIYILAIFAISSIFFTDNKSNIEYLLAKRPELIKSLSYKDSLLINTSDTRGRHFIFKNKDFNFERVLGFTSLSIEERKSIESMLDIRRERAYRLENLFALSLILFPAIYLLTLGWIYLSRKHYKIKSFILLTTKSNEKYTQYTQEKSELTHLSLSAVVVAIITSITASWIYSILIL